MWYTKKNESKILYLDGSYTGTVNFDCVPGFLSVTAGSDPVNVGVVIVIVFFIILILAILGNTYLIENVNSSTYHKKSLSSVHVS